MLVVFDDTMCNIEGAIHVSGMWGGGCSGGGGGGLKREMGKITFFNNCCLFSNCSAILKGTFQM